MSTEKSLRAHTGNHFRPKSAPLTYQLEYGAPHELSTNTDAVIRQENPQPVPKKNGVWKGASERQPVITRPRSAHLGNKVAAAGGGAAAASRLPSVGNTSSALTVNLSSNSTTAPQPGSDAGGGFGAPDYAMDVGHTRDNDPVNSTTTSSVTGDSTTNQSSGHHQHDPNTTASGVVLDKSVEEVEGDPLFKELMAKAHTSAQRSAIYKRMMGRESANKFVAVKSLKRPTSALSDNRSKLTHSSLAIRNQSPSPLLTSTHNGGNTRPTSASSGTFFNTSTTRSNVAGFKEPQTATSIEQRLIEALSVLYPEDDKAFERLQAHRLAFAEYIQTVPLQAQGLLNRIYGAYEGVVLHEYKSNFDSLFRRLKVSEERSEAATSQVTEYQCRIEGMKLEISNLEREVNMRNELLSQISSTYKINVSMVNWITGVESKLGMRTMAEIRTVQKRVTTAYGEAQRAAARDDEEAVMAQQLETEAQREQQQREMQQAEDVISRALNGDAESDELEKSTEGGILKASTSNNLARHNTTITPIGGSEVLSLKKKGSTTRSPNDRARSPNSDQPQTQGDLYRNSQRIANIGVDLEIEANNPNSNYVQPTTNDVRPE